MSRIWSGVILLVAGGVMRVLAELIMPAPRGSPNVVVAGLMFVWILASVVLSLFGLFRIIVGIVGLATGKRAPKS